jgi:hypothetical protein
MHLFYRYPFRQPRHVEYPGGFKEPAVAVDEVARVLVHAEEVRLNHASERVDVWPILQQWRGAGAGADAPAHARVSDDMLAKCSERASALANWSFSSGSGAFWDGDDDDDDDDA